MNKPVMPPTTRTGRLTSTEPNHPNTAKQPETQPVPDMSLEADSVEAVDETKTVEEGDDAEEPESLKTLMHMLVGVGGGKSLVPARELLDRLMPDTRAEAAIFVGKIQRISMAMEQLRNRAMELSYQRPE